MNNNDTTSKAVTIKSDTANPTACHEDWSCLGSISIDRRIMLVIWECTWHAVDTYHSLRRDGYEGWLVHAKEGDQLLIAWEPTLERKSLQLQPLPPPLEPIVEVRRDRPGLLGYIASKELRTHDRRLWLVYNAGMQASSPPVNEPAAESSPPSSNRQEKKRKHVLERDDRKRRRGDGQQKIRAENNLVETKAHFWYVQPACPPRGKARLAGKDREEVTKRVLHRIRHTKAISNVAILNPNHKEGAETPRYAAIRLSEVIGEEDQARLSKLIDALKDAGA
ncbi:hypothetical protein CC86DRAFT_414067 [Ophiobolus disseminans]|uniref:Uncharacterized protein n=1 Tax=Ophiobolus disseminans TaxID=1469910 RepID=A0A6A6ZDB9_9PLEO|nr:hypothetical protein CC86DRAFT_414067 [Ophiobolus disseminans]